MNLLRSERNDRELARAMGIRARQEELGADSLLANDEFRQLCEVRDHRGMKMLVGDFLQGWSVQRQLEGVK